MDEKTEYRELVNLCELAYTQLMNHARQCTNPHSMALYAMAASHLEESDHFMMGLTDEMTQPVLDALAEGGPDARLHAAEQLERIACGQILENDEILADSLDGLEQWLGTGNRYEEYDRATSAEGWVVETTIDPYDPAAFPTRVVPVKSENGTPSVRFDHDLIESSLEQGLITTSVGDSALWVTIDGYEFKAQEQDEFYVDKTDADVSRDDVIKSILDTLDLIEREPNDKASVRLAECVAYLNEHVDRSDSGNPDAKVPTISFDFYGERCTLALYSDRYQSNDNLALAAIDISENSEDFGEQWGTFTVNLPDDPVAADWCSRDGNVILDTNNNPQALFDALMTAGVIEITGESVRSGFCTYPLATITPQAMGSLMSYPETVERILAHAQKLELSSLDHVRDWYMQKYPGDELGAKINPALTFEDALGAASLGSAFYDELGVGDSIVRERVFQELADRNGVDYDAIYEAWLYKKPVELTGREAQGISLKAAAEASRESADALAGHEALTHDERDDR